jgi:hypothetical protein
MAREPTFTNTGNANASFSKQTPITPGATSLANSGIRALYIAVAGNIQLTTINDAAGSSQIFPVVAQQVIPCFPLFVGASTTATVIGWGD